MIFKVYGARDEITEATIEHLNKTRKDNEDIMVFDIGNIEGYNEAVRDNIRYLPSVVCFDDNYTFIDILENICWHELEENGEYISRNWLHDLDEFIACMRDNV